MNPSHLPSDIASIDCPVSDSMIMYLEVAPKFNKEKHLFLKGIFSIEYNDTIRDT